MDTPGPIPSPDLSDRINVLRRDTEIAYYLETIRHRVERGGVHTVTYTLSPAYPYASGFIFDTSQFDTGTFGY